MQKILAKFFTYVFHPLLIPSYFLLIVFNSPNYLALTHFGIQKVLYIVFFILTIMLPISSIPVLINMKIISSFQLNNRSERMIPLFITTSSYASAYYLMELFDFPIPSEIKIFMLGCTIAIFLTLLISLKWKISAHMVASGGLTGMLLFLSITLSSGFLLILLIWILICGFIGFSRLYLNSHLPSEIYSGYSLGLLIILAVMIIF